MCPVRHPMAVRLAVIAMALAIGAVYSSTAHGQAIDPHRLYEQRCARCHEPHAGDFARKGLKRVDGRIVGAENGLELRAFLSRGHGRLAPAELDAMVDHLTRIAHSGAIYQRKCLTCHERAIVLARRELTIVEGRLVGRFSGRDMAAFLTRHGRLAPDEVAPMVATLRLLVETKPAD